LSATDLQAICSFYKYRKIRKREYFVRQGEVCRFEGFVVKGCFKISTTDIQGKEKILNFSEEGWWLMEISSFMNTTASEFNIQALEDSEILFINKTDKENLYRENPLAERLFRLLSQTALVAWQRRMVRDHTMNAEQRYHHFITTYPNIARRVTNKHIANYLGITQESVSKIRKKWALEGN
ncbi:MAG: Crp/Fnr family transcriptional regulator, partial [Bacteroidota bacterium]